MSMIRPATQDLRTPDAREPSAADIGRQRAAAALMGEDALLEPLDRLQAASEGWRLAARELNEERPDPATVRDAISRIPTDAACEELAAEVERAAAAAPSGRANSGFVGVLLEAFPSTRGAHPVVAMEALLHDLKRHAYPPAAVALACRSLRETETFRPSIAEILKACDEAQERLIRAASTCRRLPTWRQEQLERLQRLEARQGERRDSQ